MEWGWGRRKQKGSVAKLNSRALIISEKPKKKEGITKLTRVIETSNKPRAPCTDRFDLNVLDLFFDQALFLATDGGSVFDSFCRRMSCSLTLELRGVITSLEGLFPRGTARRLPSSGVSGRNARGVQLGNLLERKTFDLSVVCSGLAVDSSRGGEIEFVLELASGMKKYT